MNAVLDLDALEAMSFHMLLTEIRTKATARAWFDITCFASLPKIFDDRADTAARAGREYKLLQRLHCVDIKSMAHEVRDAIPALVEAVIETARADFEKRQVQP